MRWEALQKWATAAQRPRSNGFLEPRLIKAVKKKKSVKNHFVSEDTPSATQKLSIEERWDQVAVDHTKLLASDNHWLVVWHDTSFPSFIAPSTEQEAALQWLGQPQNIILEKVIADFNWRSSLAYEKEEEEIKRVRRQTTTLQSSRPNYSSRPNEQYILRSW